MPAKKSKNKIAVKNKSAVKKKIEKAQEINIDSAEDSEIIQQKLTTLAHFGTKDSLTKISEFIATTLDEDLRGFARCAYDEAEFFYYSPENDQEEKEFLIAKMIKEKDDNLLKLEMKAEDIRFDLKELEIDREVNKKMLANSKNKAEKEEWKYLFSEDHFICTQNELAAIESDINYEYAWIAEAEKLIKTEKFKNLPENFFEHVHFDGENKTSNKDEIEEEFNDLDIPNWDIQ
jgi:hypothetical protein